MTTMPASYIKTRYDDIIKSARDQRLYRGIELTNGMKVLLISDSSTDKSSAAMDVHIGHLSDPGDVPGLAHFCEHMLFLGTEKYPAENEYSKFLSEHGGSSNAFTSGEHTNFYFDVSPQSLSDALDRFSQFFHSPLFTASATEREVNAVNSENDKNLASDMWRLHQLEKATCDPNHDFSKFGTGNKETLLTRPRELGLDVRDELLKFHNKFYSSNIMSLAVLGKESLDELAELVVPLFHDVVNKNVEVPKWLQHPAEPDYVKLQANVVPVKDIRSLHVTWPIPDLHEYYKSSPGHYLGHLIGHEGQGSLLSELKLRGWVNTLVGGEKLGANGFGFFIVNVDLTEVGTEHTDDIIELIFQYLNLLRESGPQEWVFNECKDLNVMHFRFKDKERPRSYTCAVAATLHDFPMQECLWAAYLMEEYRPDLITSVLSKLTPDNMRVAVIGKKWEGKTDRIEPWYGTEYSVNPISEDKLKKWKNAGLHANLKLPVKNEFIPTNFELFAQEEETSVNVPQIIHNGDMSCLWFKQDDKFLMPKCCVSIDVISPYAYMDPLSTCLNHMFVTLFKDSLTEYAYDAELAGLHYSLNSSMYGLTLNFRGYNDKQHVLVQKVMDRMVTFKVDPKRFDIWKENYIRGLKNFQTEQPHQHAIYYTNLLMSEQCWSKEELLDATEDLTVARLESFIPQLLSRLFLEFLVYGNVTAQKARDLVSIIEKSLSEAAGSRALPVSQRRRFREVQLPDGCYYLYKRTNQVHKSSSLEVYYQCNVQETRANMLLELFVQIISEPCFDILRTQEQLGYIVFSGIRRSSGVQGLRVIVQSDKTSSYVESRVEAFLVKMGEHLEKMDAGVFDKHVEALSTKRLELPKKLSAQNAKYWGEIVSQQYNFDRDNIEVQELKTLGKQDIIDFYQEVIAPTAPKRHKLSVHVVSSANHLPQQDTENNKEETTSPIQEPLEVTDVHTFRTQLGLFPLAKPYVPVTANGAKSKL